MLPVVWASQHFLLFFVLSGVIFFISVPPFWYHSSLTCCFFHIFFIVTPYAAVKLFSSLMFLISTIPYLPPPPLLSPGGSPFSHLCCCTFSDYFIAGLLCFTSPNTSFFLTCIVNLSTISPRTGLSFFHSGLIAPGEERPPHKWYEYLVGREAWWIGLMERKKEKGRDWLLHYLQLTRVLKRRINDTVNSKACWDVFSMKYALTDCVYLSCMISPNVHIFM